MSIGIAELVPLGAAPDPADILVVVNVDNPSQSPQGSTQNMTVANLFTSPSIATPTLMGATHATGNIIQINNAFLEGTTTGAATVAVIGVSGANKVIIDNSGLGTIFNGTATATRLIGGTDITSAVGKLVVSDGTAIGGTFASANSLGIASQFVTAATTGNPLAISSYIEQTVANTGGPQAIEGYVRLAHTSGVVGNALATIGNIEVGGNGGTTTVAASIQGGGTVTNGTVTTFRTGWFRRAVISGGGAIGTHVGVEIDSISGASTNIALRTNGGNVVLTLPTSSSGLTSGMLWNNGNVVNIVP